MFLSPLFLALGFLHRGLFVIALQEGVQLPVGLIADHRVQTDGVDAVEDALFDVGVVPLQPPQQGLHLLPLRAAAAVVADGSVFREAAGALDKLQVVIPPPGDDAVLVDAVQGAG